jgi:hypothetical protein
MAIKSILASSFALVALAAPPAAAQEGPNGLINPNRDCQTLLTCNFSKHGKYRGCVSSYSCRVCRFVRSKCSIGGRRRGVCERLRCSWGA